MNTFSEVPVIPFLRFLFLSFYGHHSMMGILSPNSYLRSDSYPHLGRVSEQLSPRCTCVSSVPSRIDEKFSPCLYLLVQLVNKTYRCLLVLVHFLDRADELFSLLLPCISLVSGSTGIQHSAMSTCINPVSGMVIEQFSVVYLC